MKDIGEALFGFLRIDRGRGFSGGTGVRVINVRLKIGYVSVQSRKVLVGVTPVHIAERDDVLTCEIN